MFGDNDFCRIFAPVIHQIKVTKVGDYDIFFSSSVG